MNVRRRRTKGVNAIDMPRVPTHREVSLADVTAVILAMDSLVMVRQLNRFACHLAL